MRWTSVNASEHERGLLLFTARANSDTIACLPASSGGRSTGPSHPDDGCGQPSSRHIPGCHGYATRQASRTLAGRSPYGHGSVDYLSCPDHSSRSRVECDCDEDCRETTSPLQSLVAVGGSSATTHAAIVPHMSSSRYGPPPASTGDLRRYSNKSGIEVHVRREHEGTLAILDRQHGGRVGEVVEHLGGLYTCEPRGVGIPRITAPVSWDELIDRMRA